MNTLKKEYCRNCDQPLTGAYCSSCGEKAVAQRISFSSIIHEAFHFFTHLDHGFPYTLKKLVTSPGTVQKDYIAGNRKKYQKPFSMFFISATVTALAMYWISLYLMHYQQTGDTKETLFFHKYWVLLQICMLPFYACITYVFFRKSRYNYGEIVVFQLYVLSFLFIVVLVIHLFKLLIPDFQTRYVELPVFIAYTLITNLNFFSGYKKIEVVVLSILTIIFNFVIAGMVQDYLINGF